MFKFAPYVLKTLTRHRARTLLTVSGAAVSVFVYCFVLAVQEGLARLTTQDDSVLVVFQANKFCPATSHLPQDYEHAISKMPGVREVVPIQVFTNNCRASLDVVVFYGTHAEQVRKVRDFELVSGSWDEFESNQDTAIVGQALVERRSRKLGQELSVGRKLTIGDVTVTIAGIYTSENRAEEDYIYCHLDFLQRTRGTDLVGTVTQHEVFLDASADPQQVASALDLKFKSGQVQTDTRTKGVFQASSLQDLIQLIDLMRYLGFACLGLMTVLLATTTVMGVEDRIREHAVLQTIGVTGARVFRLVLSECVLVSFFGGLAGVLIAVVVLATSSLSVGAEAVSIAFAPSTSMATTGVLVSALIGIAAGIAPAWRAAQADIVNALRYAG
ncbi:MAG: ABC transporter permease [Planctomycetaceae bacterium]|nr:ABC transporter permease [Planctomycetaceae bacterium]